jgi:peptidoglycan/xylan/chitin deacetylase (PgdA/CDA1 family)
VNLKKAVKRAIARPPVWRATSALRAKGWIVLTYHRIGGPDERFTHLPVEVFREQMRWIRTNCDVIDPATLTHQFAPPGGRRPSVLITFDDGYKDYYERVCPILRECGVRAINFLPTRYIDESRTFWWDLLDAASQATTRERVMLPSGDGREVKLDMEGRRHFARHCKNMLKRMAAPDQAPLFDEALTALGFDRTNVPLARQTMTWDEVRSVSDVTAFGGHTHTHPIMPLLDAATLEREIATCTARIGEETGSAPRFFAYPSGAFDRSVRNAVGRAGYDIAFTTVEGFNNDTTDWLTLNRVHGRATLAELVWVLAGWDSGVATQ